MPGWIGHDGGLGKRGEIAMTDYFNLCRRIANT
jgi:hypothetical protein